MSEQQPILSEGDELLFMCSSVFLKILLGGEAAVKL